MPTGYTDMIKDDTTFKQFAMRCARAFGACVTMRDDPIDKDIPLFEPSSWHIEQIKADQKELERISNLSDDDASLESKKEYDRKIEEYKEYISKAERTRQNYDRILLSARTWIPPTDDHKELKKFMIDQIESSIRCDCDNSYYHDKIAAMEVLSGADWKAMKIKELQESLKYHEKHHREEIERVEGRNRWVRELRRAL